MIFYLTFQKTGISFFYYPHKKSVRLQISPFKFDWQAGYSAFSYSRSHMDAVCKYILNQKEHHRKRTFEEEFMKMIVDFVTEIGKKKMFDFFLPD